MNKTYTIILHKPESHDYCKGCHMASYSGDMQIFGNLSFEESAKKLAEFLSIELDYSEEGYTAYIPLDGEVYEIDSVNWGQMYFGGDNETKDADIQNLVDRVRILCKEIKENKALEKAAKEKAAKDAEKLAKIASEKRQLELLKAKYEQNKEKE